MSDFEQTFTSCSKQLSQLFDDSKVDSTHGIAHALLIVDYGRETLKHAKLDKTQE